MPGTRPESSASLETPASHPTTDRVRMKKQASPSANFSPGRGQPRTSRIYLQETQMEPGDWRGPVLPWEAAVLTSFT